jgi:hypothetical protein
LARTGIAVHDLLPLGHRKDRGRQSLSKLHPPGMLEPSIVLQVNRDVGLPAECDTIKREKSTLAVSETDAIEARVAGSVSGRIGVASPVKARSIELLDRAIAATVAAIEIYNKPDFQYREETFAVLATNGWELLLKAKWLALNQNKVRSLYVTGKVTTAKGNPSQKLRIKKTRSGNPFTHSIDFLAKDLVQKNLLEQTVWKNIQALLEIRDSAVHFYNPGGAFAMRLQEIGAASLKNFVAVVGDWFGRGLDKFNFYLMPLSFMSAPTSLDAVMLNPAEKRFLNYVNSLEDDDDKDQRFAVTVNIQISFTRSKAKDALAVAIDNTDPKATKIRLTEEDIRSRYPWEYKQLTDKCRSRYKDFKIDAKFHKTRKAAVANPQFGNVRLLDPGNPKSQKKPFFSPNILLEFDKVYSKK